MNDPPEFLELKKLLQGARRHLNKALKVEVEPCPFTGEHSELLADTIRQVRDVIVEVERKFVTKD